MPMRPWVSCCTVCLAPVLLPGCGSGDAGPSAPDLVATVSLSPASALVEPGQSVRLSPTLRDSRRLVVTGRDVIWASSDSSVATVTGGLVLGVREGFAVITATVDGSTGSASVTVQRSAVSVEIRPENPTIAVGTTVQLIGRAVGGNGRMIEGLVVYWSTSDPTVARVDAGKVRGLRAGTAEITATSDGKSAVTTAMVVPNVAGSWTFTSLTADSALGLSCRTSGTLTLSQTGAIFGGTLERRGSCTGPEGDVDQSGRFTVGESAISADRLDFMLDGEPRCAYVGALSGRPARVAGDVSCFGELGGASVALRGTWEMLR